MGDFDFSGYVTKNNILCSDGRTIRKDAFKHNDGQTVPLFWNHKHDENYNVLGNVLLENRPDGVYGYGKFNDTEAGRNAKLLVQHGDITHMSIYANKLKHNGRDVIHGSIREVSLVPAGANEGARIDYVLMHSEGSDEDAIISIGEDNVDLYHGDGPTFKPKREEPMDTLKHNYEEMSVEEVIDTMDPVQQDVFYAMVAEALDYHGEDDDYEDYDDDDYDDDDYDDEDYDDYDDYDYEGDDDVKHNVFDMDDRYEDNYLSHADQMEILELAKKPSVGSFKEALTIYGQQTGTLSHGIDDIELLFPDYKDVRPGAPELIQRDQSWVAHVMRSIHKSPIARIRTRQAEARISELRAKGYQKPGDEKTLSANIKLLSRVTDPQTVYRKDQLNRDDIIDITDFDVVEYQWRIMRANLEEEIALAALIGDGRPEGDPDKIHETHIRSIWNDDDLYTIHQDVDIEKVRAELQGTDTAKYFGDNYIYAEGIVQSSLYAREQYKGSGSLDFYCTPHLLNVMLLSRDRDGRRMYSSKADLQAALNVSNIFTIEQFEGKTRTTTDGKTKKLLGLFVNLGDYQFGSTKGGEITKFDQFDIDFNTYKYLIETRLSGALTRVYSAIALEEDITEAEAAG